MTRPAFLPRYQKVANVIRKRVLHGDYVLKPIPSERSLARELGVNAMTARRGLQILEQEGLLERLQNGRVCVKKARDGASRHLNLVLLTPTLVSHWIESCRLAIEKITADLQGNIRTILYTHWDDPLLLDALSGFDGVFLLPSPVTPPAALLNRLRSQKHPVVILDRDMSGLGLPSIQLFPASFVQKLLDHLASQQHEGIGCLNTQPDDPVVTERINAWRYWMEAHGLPGSLVNRPVQPYGSSMEQAYRVMADLLSGPKLSETAWFCTTIDCAIGAMKAMQDHGLRPGRDLALCAANGEGLAQFMTPAITALEAADPAPLISYCVKWMMQGGTKWNGPLLMQPVEVPLVIRESSRARQG
jgi:DNA-binding LacI/PurR family transcriptional regulator